MKNIALLLGFFLILSCKKDNKTAYYLSQGNAFGSTYAIQYEYHEDLSQEIKDDLNFFDKLISTYREDSEIMKFNTSTNGIETDSIIIDLVSQCKKFHQITNGYFDPTVAPLSSLYGFSNKKITHYPSQEEINEALGYIGLDNIEISLKRLTKKHPKTELNFNAITGYINDFIAQKFKQKNIKNYLIEIGGEIYADGVNKDGKTWTVGIDVPEEIADERKLYTTHSLKKEGLATSGNYRKYHLLADGRKIVHTINPKNGSSKASNLLSSTVIAESTAEADALATSLMAMGLENATDFAQKHDYKILLIYHEEGALKSKTFNGF